MSGRLTVRPSWLRPLTTEDIDELAVIHAKPEVRRFMGLFDRRRVSEWLALVEQDYAEGRPGRLAVIRTAQRPVSGPQRSEVLAAILRDRSRLGATSRRMGARLYHRSRQRLRGVGFPELNVSYLTAMVKPDNPRSIAVAQRIGMSPLRSDTLLGDPVTVYSISRDEWKPSGRTSRSG